ncbi:hypothetical protein BUALT_Bualt02G0106800 [Buddleja alternifolia]|uniref:SAM domain-containing protein n=1 Tax=Buddleja alternifolia TaxID=168488 RepID=A0AAV6XZ96_9LAMI|nr:hypothetical protein BUALT_Bualt02G0106800 [Buddleja alternifolia]
MDWFTWLSRTNLDPSLVYNYSLTFSHNELEQEDVPYFTHEFLQSMGISIAKHRVEILKLARKHHGTRTHPISWFLFAIKQTKNYLIKHIQSFVHRENSSHNSLVPKRNHSLRWKVAMLQRSKRSRSSKQEWRLKPRNDHKILMITNGSPESFRGNSVISSSSRTSSWVETESNVESGRMTREAMANNPLNSSFSSTMVQTLEGEYWSSSTEEIKWDSMFQNLKPT